jgi:membrane fusion protein, multidrug efflux system
VIASPVLRRLARNRLVLGGGGVIAGLLTVMALTPSHTVWSDAHADITKAPPRLALDNAALAGTAPDAVTLAGATVADAEAVSAHGMVKAGEEAVLASRMTALITALPLEAGQSFVKGQTLISFDCAQMKAQLNAAQASADAYRKTYDTNVELDQYKAIGKADVAVSKANLGKATAEAQAIQAGLGQCAIVAPFSGTVVERIAHPHDVAAPGAPLMKIQGVGDLEVELIVPSNWLTWLKPGTPFSFGIDETGASVNGRITQLGAAVDPVSKTIRVTGHIDVSGTVLPGMSGTAHFAKAGDDRAA